MKPVAPSEIKTNQDYALERSAVRERVMKVKASRRVAVGGHITLLFENRETVLYQVQEMMRVEGITEPKAIAHELATYNELIAGPDELKATLLIEYAEEKERDQWLRKLLGLENHVHIEVQGAGRATAEFDMRQVAEERISSVHYIRFDLSGGAAAALRAGASANLVVDHPALQATAPLGAEALAALAEDLRHD